MSIVGGGGGCGGSVRCWWRVFSPDLAAFSAFEVVAVQLADFAQADGLDGVEGVSHCLSMSWESLW